MEVRDLAGRARSQLAEVTALKPQTVTGAVKDEQGWHITLDMLEMARIPNSTDILGSYEVLLDDNGNMLSFKRKRIRLRGEPVAEEARA